MKKGLYNGYSSYELTKTGSFLIQDIECVKLDLLNHIFTRVGERVMMPTFGTVIPDLAFQPVTQETVDTIVTELERVFNMDPRVQLLDISPTVEPDKNYIQVTATVLYIELNITAPINFSIDVGSSGN